MKWIVSLILALFIAVVVSLGAASAQAPRPSLLQRNANPQNEPGAAQAQSLGDKIDDKVKSKFFEAIAKPFRDLAEFIGDDLDAAAKLSIEIPELQDTNGQACWTGMQQFGKVVKAHPVPLTFKLATDLQALRLLVMASNNVCSNTACRTVFGDLSNVVEKAAPIGVPFDINPISLACSKIAQLAPQMPVGPVTPTSSPPAPR